MMIRSSYTLEENDRTVRTSYTVDRGADHEYSEKRGQQMVQSALIPERPAAPPPPPPPASGARPETGSQKS
jgi:hypothetical protein